MHFHQIDLHIARRVRRLRIERGLSRQDLAGKLGISSDELGCFERGTKRVGAAMLLEFAKTLDIGVNELFEGLRGQGPTRTDGNGRDDMVVGEGLELMRAFAQIDDFATRTLIIKFVRSFVPRIDE